MRPIVAIALGAALFGVAPAFMSRGTASAQSAVPAGQQYVVGVSGMT